ncbi:MAG: UbiX family flavin prenyltransferase [Alphaproteobacteria bacterium]|nr:UbiX family flavin prenyltransferase [Alphaproteobacteria bacterium]MBU1563189.1 UbiX family flavin prenyltransferase [Alphaproteobacteria bacterium]MBU2303910.1 UbiX family flavin prenyltransferase [Alphaproteobacteria bacterium]MBU2368308.1 UbiX family flavin prenyltransferase [Alphaproteobacteria bacterium]
MTRVVVGMTGASGAAIGLRVLELLRTLPGIETHLVLSAAAERTLAHEGGVEAAERARMLAHVAHAIDDIGASIASGSFSSAGMLVVPCSMHSLGAIAAGIADNLIVRAADVHLKERRRLVLMARETPLHLGHLRNMVSVTEMGAIVMPPVPAFYHLPRSVEEVVDQLAARAIDLLGLPGGPLAREWRG